MEGTWWYESTPAGEKLRRVLIYTWDSGWAVPTEYVNPNIMWRSLGNNIDAVPIVPVRGEDDYSTTLVRLPTTPGAPVPAGLRPVASPNTMEMMLRIIRLRMSPVMAEPFSSGLIRISKMQQSLGEVRSRKDLYLAGLIEADPYEFARAYRDMAERRRLNRTVGAEERLMLNRLFRDLVVEVEHSLGVSAEEAARIVTKAQGFEITALSGRRPRKEK